ncbi:hypothetical protein AC482_00460 [miscellaneous Crenarchaeota group-15 archaeon DG-45]|uniref:Microcystin degradation protein MlrC n=1 Tax=miscellaneous Crenarchaeota group-15 archaeon DG-45 TaxID=1685127 RepID=A0A0M0BTK1_9ARCH|nr:MAG: hypothetical protein AC482_00460 [miscellaneous Crenarchaeota group-15 archaeon DG-45]
MRISIGKFAAESNAFSIEEPSVHATYDQDLLLENMGKKTVLGGFIDAITRADIEIVPTLEVGWESQGMVPKDGYEFYRGQLLQRIREAGNLDGVLLALHGAMTAEDSPDGEGKLLEEIRRIVGERVPIVCVMDMHANLSDLKVRMADAILGYKTNPHVDAYERGLEASEMLLTMLGGEVKPIMHLERLPMLGHNIGMSTWAYDASDEERLPMARIMNEVKELETVPGMLDISVFIGFAHADVPWCTSSILTISNGNPALAQSTAEKVAKLVWDARWEFYHYRPLMPVDEAVERAVEAPEGPIILVDVADNAGGGAPCDNTVILESLLRKGAEDAVVPLRDPEAVVEAFEAGVGGSLELEVGGKIDNRFYKPVRLKVTLKTLSDGRYVVRGPHHGGHGGRMKVLPKEDWRSADVGRMALLKTENIEIIVSERRVSMERDFYKAVGVDPGERKIVVVKSAQAHRASFEGLAKEIIEVDTPGVGSAIYRGLTFQNIPRPIWPLDPI